MREIPVDPAQIVAAVVMGEPSAATFQGEQQVNQDGLPVWKVEITVAIADSGASTVPVKIAGRAAPRLSLGQPVTFVGLRARVWEMDRRHGVSYSAREIRPVGTPGPAGPAGAAGPAVGKRES
jgi:hypothetical protein